MNKEKFESFSFYNLREWNGSHFRLPISDTPISAFIFLHTVEINNITHYCFNVFSYTVFFIYIGNETITKDNISEKVKSEPYNFIIHREDDEPAISSKHKERNVFLKYGRLHRENDLPAFRNEDKEYWYYHGFLYRKNAPAKTEFSYNHNEIFEFLIFDEIIKEDFKVVEKYEDVIINNVKHLKYTNNLNQTIYFCNNKIHREDDEPAFISSRLKIWYKNGLVHRMFKPAIVYLNCQEFYYKSGRSLSNEEIKKEKVIANVNIF